MNFDAIGKFIGKWWPLMLIVIAFGGGYLIGHKPVKGLQSQAVLNDKLRDSLQVAADTLYARLNREYVANSKEKTKTKIKYVTEIREIEVARYTSMALGGRVDYFHNWVVDSTNRYLAQRRSAAPVHE